MRMRAASAPPAMPAYRATFMEGGLTATVMLQDSAPTSLLDVQM